MRKRSWILPLLLVFTLLLSACASGAEQNGTQTDVPGAIGTGTPEGIPGTGASTEVVEPTLETEPTELIPEEDLDEAYPVLETPEDVTPTESAQDETTPDAGEDSNVETPPTGVVDPPVIGEDTGVIGIPQTGSGGLIGLAAMTGWQVVGADGAEIGTVHDYVVNTCEAHILFLVVEPIENASTGQQILIPYEATLAELNEGSSVDVEQRVFTLKQNAADLNGAPVVDVTLLDLEIPDWSDEALEYWSENYRVSLTSACNVPVSNNQNAVEDANTQVQPTLAPEPTQVEGDVTPTLAPADTDPTLDSPQDTNRQNIYKLALASSLLSAELQEGNGAPLGTVRDIAIVPETGRTQFIVIETGEAGEERMVALPPGAVNISYENGAGQPVVILLVETDLLQGAPVFDESARTTDDAWYDYWNQHIPMTRDQLP